ncbi:MAG: RIP metalloprotease RseP [Planctomycetes bacterium]|nr:RIP metalloprotease RseP [Planctomycetota bacterium]
MEAAPIIFATLWNQWIWPVLLLVVGFGMVIFFHELGHFMACKAVGIRVERFAIGMGPRLCGVIHNGTDYCVRMLPLGGYVKMTGQEDLAPLKEDDGPPDPYSFVNKPIWARLIVVSAGVVMNLIVAGALFVAVCLAGISFPAPVVGGTIENFPASKAKVIWAGAPAQVGALQPRILPGDEIVEIDGRHIAAFNKISVTAALAHDEDDKFNMTLRRKVGDKEYLGTTTLNVKAGGKGRFIFGIIPTADTVFDIRPGNTSLPFKDGDRLVAIGGTPIEHWWQIPEVTAKLSGHDTEVTVNRNGRNLPITVRPVPRLARELVFLSDASVLRGRLELRKDDEKNYDLVLPGAERRTVARRDVQGVLLDVLGMMPRVRVDAVVTGSSADRAGLHVGDIILAYADHRAPTLSKLHQLNRNYVGRDTTIVVLRDDNILEPAIIRPKQRDEGAQIGIRAGIDVDHVVIAGVRKGSAAEQASLRAGDVIESLAQQEVRTWNDLVRIRKTLTADEATVTYRRGASRRTATIRGIAAAPIGPSDYEFDLFPGAPFKPLMADEVHTSNPLAAVAWGARETMDFVTMTYATLRGLAMQTLSTKELRGPIGIVDVGISVGRRGSVMLLYFLAMISVSLAVINFLPIPVVDGGHAVLLLLEKVRGRPVSVRLMNIIQGVGIALLVCVFVAVSWQDIVRILKRLWWA